MVAMSGARPPETDRHPSTANMSDPSTSRFVSQNQTTTERLSTNTIGLVALSDFRKRRAEVLEQQEREARDAILGTTTSTPNRSGTATPANASDGSEVEKRPKKKNKRAKALVSFGDDEDGVETEALGKPTNSAKSKPNKVTANHGNSEDPPVHDGASVGGMKPKAKAKFAANSAVSIAPRTVTKAALRREAAEREALRKEFLAMQTVIKATDIAIPFVFYDGANTPGGTVRVKKGDPIWVFLDKSRKVGADLRVGGEKNANARREWARISVDDLMMVRGSVIVPPHYEFYFFIMNKTLGPGNQPLFNYRAELLPAEVDGAEKGALLDPVSKGGPKPLADIQSLEGAADDPTFTKVVDRRWYERNKHIYPASVWQEFDPEKDYQSEIRRDPGGNTFFFTK